MNNRDGRLTTRSRLHAGLAALLTLTAPATWSQTPAESKVRPSVARMLETVTPAVVSISVIGTLDDLLIDDPFLGRFSEPSGEGPRFAPRHAAGSGVIIDAELGHVIT